MPEGEAANRQILVDFAFTQGMAALVMVGRQDRWSPVSQHEEIAALIPHAELVALEDSGHMFDRKRALRGYRINKMAMGWSNPVNREAFKKNEEAYSGSFRADRGGKDRRHVAQLA